MNIPNVDVAGCDVVLWRENGEIYILDVRSGEIGRMYEGRLAPFISEFPEHLTLCIMNDATGKAVRISPLAN